MRRLIVLLALAACGTHPPAIPGGSDVPPVTAPTLVRSLTCTTAGIDAVNSPYKVEFVMSHFSDGSQQNSCYATQGIVGSITCPVSDPYKLTYYIKAKLFKLGNPIIVTTPITETFSETDQNCRSASF